MIAVPLVTVAAAMAMIRAGWRGRRGLAWTGWLAAVAAVLMLAAVSGAWGISVGILAGSLVAIGCVLLAGWRSPQGRRRPRPAVATVTLPRARGDLARRVLVGVLVVPVGFAAAQWLAIAGYHWSIGHAFGEADALALALIVQPIAWATIMTIQMTRNGPADMIAAPAVAAGLGLLLWMTA